MKLKTISLSFFLVSLIPQASIGEATEEMKAAVMQVAIAANCRASYGEDELFEVAFSNFEIVAKSSEPAMTLEEIAEAKQKLYEIEADTGDNPFLRGFCKMLKEQLLPAE